MFDGICLVRPRVYIPSSMVAVGVVNTQRLPEHSGAADAVSEPAACPRMFVLKVICYKFWIAWASDAFVSDGIP